jgi:Right handed beta helix region
MANSFSRMILLLGSISLAVGCTAHPSGAAFYVSPKGNDSNPGTLAAPFATLARAQQAMAHSSSKTTYVQRGTYELAHTLSLTAADDGETWQYSAPDGVNTAVLDGGTSTADAFSLNGARHVTIDGLKIQNFTARIVDVESRSDDFTLKNCDIGNITVPPPVENTAAVSGVLVNDSRNVLITHNYFHDISSDAIAVGAYNAGDTIDGTVISGNVILNADTQTNDGGPIGTGMHATHTDAGTIIISNNYITGWGNPDFSPPPKSMRCIYLDDDTSNSTVTGNVCGPPNAGLPPKLKGSTFQGVLVNGGCCNTISGNLFDIGGRRRRALLQVDRSKCIHE